jgi:PAS domain S-box-containing protein
MGAAVVVLSVAVAISIILALRFVAAERERDLQGWQNRLAIVADSRAAAVNDWVEGQFAELAGLADNAALQIYLTELVSDPNAAGRSGRSLAESGYLRNLLTMVAGRAGFRPRKGDPEIAANVRRNATAGIALVRQGRIVVSTEGMPPIDGRIAEFLAAARPGSRMLLDIYRGAAGTPTMAFAVPVFAVQQRGDAARQLGWALGVREVADALYPLLEQPGTPWKTAESLLLRRNDAGIEYLSPTHAGDAPLTRTMAADTPGLAASFAVQQPGGFAASRDYLGTEVLATARRIAAAPWTLLYKIDRSEALGDSDARLSRLTVFLLLAVALVVAALVAAWWHGSTLRAEEATARYRDLARRFETQSRMLQAVSDNQPGALFVVDDKDRFRFANRAAAARAGISVDDLMGKTLQSVFGPADAERYHDANVTALAHGERVVRVHSSGANGSTRVLQAEHVPVAADPSVLPHGVMVVEEDVTAAVAERARRERTLDALVATLVAVIDSRDPNAARHSARVAGVARAIAEEMGLDPVLAGAAETAGRLMNIGKVLVPGEVLTRAGALDERERRLVRMSIERGADLLQKVEFDGPVAETLRQIHERWDGAGGPAGLAGDQILPTAQVVAVANAFVALASPRAWRAGLPVDEAAARLAGEAGAAFDRRPLTALQNLIENRGARQEWGDFSVVADAP